MLVDEYAVVAERLEAVAVELLCEKSFAGAEWVCRVDDYEVVLLFDCADEFEAVLEMQRDARVVELAGGEGQQLHAGLDDELVYIYHVDFFNRLVARKLAHRAAVAAADYEDALDLRVRRHRDVDYHVVVDEFVLLGQHH